MGIEDIQSLQVLLKIATDYPYPTIFIAFALAIIIGLGKLGYHFSDLSNLFIQTILSTLLVLITAEFLPKVFFQIYANFFIRFFAVPAYFFYWLFYFISTLKR